VAVSEPTASANPPVFTYGYSSLAACTIFTRRIYRSSPP
jgi:hypothetical protein